MNSMGRLRLAGICMLAPLTLAGVSSSVSAAAVDLSLWSAESYPAVSGFGAGIWTVNATNDSVTQSVNGQPTVFYSDFPAFGTAVEGTIRVANSGGDDDYIGFVLGFQPYDSTNPAADYLLVDWKRAPQSYNFGTPSASPGGNAPAGLAVSRVFGIPDADEFWQHTNLSGTPETSGLQELARGATLGSTRWEFNRDYVFTFDFGPHDLQIYVDDVLQFDLAGDFSNGRLGFYNFSQAQVIYSAFTVEEGSFTVVPIPAAAWLLGSGLMGLLTVARRKTL
ncbi:MAG: VPLPA-CTERM sorting domain-containing protein [Porticoccaceae bacterium]